VCIGFATRAQSSDLPWTAMGYGHDRRADWGIAREAEESWLPLELVSRAHQITDGGSDGVMSFLKQKIKQRHHLRDTRRSLMESPTKSPPPSIFNFQPTLQTPTFPSQDVIPFSSPQLLQVLPLNFSALFCFASITIDIVELF
jgi:hypothetical protein